MKLRLTFGVLVALLALPLAATPQAYAATTHDVTLGAKDAASVDDLSFSPAYLVISQGDTVRWNTASYVPHTVTSATGLFDSTPQFNATVLQQIGPILFGPGGFLLPGGSFTTTLNQSGNYTYYCKIHPGMLGNITVTSQPAALGEVVYVNAGWGSESISFNSYSPRQLTVHLSTTIVWTNQEVYEPHTVTSATVPSGAQPFDSSPNLTPELLAGFGSLPFLRQGGQTSLSYTFTQAGTFSYFCKLHTGMRGYVTVLSPPAPTDLSKVNSDISKVNSDLSTVNSRLDLGTVLSGVAIVLGVIGASISAAVWRKLPKKTPT